MFFVLLQADRPVIGPRFLGTFPSEGFLRLAGSAFEELLPMSRCRKPDSVLLKTLGLGLKDLALVNLGIPTEVPCNPKKLKTSLANQIRKDHGMLADDAT